MHYASLVEALRDVDPATKLPTVPPSLAASLAMPEPGGDPCKAWRLPNLCDAKAIHVPKEITWRAAPPCIEVDLEKKTPAR